MRVTSTMEKVRLLNTMVSNLSMAEAVEEIEHMIARGKKAYVVAVNVDVIVKIEQDEELRHVIDNADMVLTDGQPLLWISRLHRRAIKQKVSGSDLVPELCEVSAEKGYSIFILGGQAGVAEAAKEKLEKKYPTIHIVGTYAPPVGFEKDEAEQVHINKLISQAAPDLLIVCFGCPKQEKWIWKNIDKYDAKVSLCAGATVDFLAGNIKRAPKCISACGFEWLYRFFKEPKRLFKRYFVDDLKIVKLILKYR